MFTTAVGQFCLNGTGMRVTQLTHQKSVLDLINDQDGDEPTNGVSNSIYSPNQSEPRGTDSDMTDESEDEHFQKRNIMFENSQKKKDILVEKRVKTVPAINGKTRPPKRKGAQKEETKMIESSIGDERQIESNNSSFNSNQSDLDAQSAEKKQKGIEKPVELKSLLGNSLGSYWNDGSLMVPEKRKRKSVMRLTLGENGSKQDEEDDHPEKIKPNVQVRTKRSYVRKTPIEKNEKRKSTLSDTNEKTRPSKRKAAEKAEKENAKGADDQSVQSVIIPYDDVMNLKGSARRKKHTTYTKHPISIAFHSARTPIKNFNLCPYQQPSHLLIDCSNYLIKDFSSLPLDLALDATELIHVSEYKQLMQNKTKTRKSWKNQKDTDLDKRRPGYSRSKEELKQFLTKLTVERKIHAQERAAGRADSEYQKEKAKLLNFLENFKQD